MFSSVTAKIDVLVGVDPGCLPPPVAIQRRLPRMARLAKAAQIRKVETAAMLERQDVVYFLHRRCPALH